MEELKKSQAITYTFSYFLNFPLSKPLFINIGLTHQCNLRCRICETWKFGLRKENELSIFELKRIIEEIGRWGKINVSFAGGEPLLRKNKLITCIKEAKKWNLPTHMTTNGQLIDRNTAYSLVASGLDYINISIDGATKETNDYIRGKGTFERAFKAIEELKKVKEELNSKIKISLTTVVTDKNIDELLQIVKMVEELELFEVSFNPYNIDTSYTQEKSYEEDEFWVKEKNILKLRKICKELIKIKKSKGIIGTPFFMLKMMPDYFEKKMKFKEGICIAGYTYLYIKPNGIVDICGKGPFLNVKEHSLRYIWYSINSFATRIKIMKCKRPCLMLCFPRITLKDLVK